MLRELSVQNLALIEDVHVALEGGYCVWTGETGAGKSLLLTALGLVLGGKAAAEMIRSGKAEARAAAVFEIDRTRDEGRDRRHSGRLDRRRRADHHPPDHRTRPRQRPRQRPAGDREHTAKAGGVPGRYPRPARRARLLDPARQRDLLDAYGGLVPKLAAYSAARQAHETLRLKRQALIESVEFRERERALLEYERDELAAAEPKAGEYAELAREANLLRNAGQIRSTAAAGYSLLYEADRSAQDVLSRVARSLEPLCDAADELGAAVSTLERLADETREVAYSLRGLAEGWGEDPARLESLENRMALYRRLATRFHCSGDDLAERLASTELKLERIGRDDSELESLEKPLALAWAALKREASALSEAPEARQGISARYPETTRSARARQCTAVGRGRDSRAGRRSAGAGPNRVGRRPGRDALLGKPR